MSQEDVARSVARYEECLHATIAELEHEFGVPLPGLIAKARSLGRASGATASGSSFRFHGAGCSVEMHGAMVSFDVLVAGKAVFDAWRVAQFCGDTSPPALAEIQHELVRRVALGELETVDAHGGWFALSR